MYKYRGIKINGIKRDEHRVIVEKHIGRKLTRKEVVHHVDGDTRNNDISNLCIMSLSDHSCLHMTDIVRKRGYVAPSNTHVLGENVGTSKLTNLDVIKIKRFIKNETFKIKDIAIMFNVHRTTICRIKSGILWGWLV